MSNHLASFIIAGLFAAPTFALGASVSGKPTTQPTMPADLSEVGTLDWAYWSVTSDSYLPAQAPTNSKAGGIAIGNAMPVNHTGLRGSPATNTAITFRFDDGTGPLTDGGTAAVMRGVFAQPGSSGSRGVQVTVILPEADQLYTVMMWVSGYRARGEISATLDGATSYIDSSIPAYADAKIAQLYELSVMADEPNDVLNLSYYQKSGGDPNSHVLLGGIAISAVPEPATLGLLAPVVLLGLRRRQAR